MKFLFALVLTAFAVSNSFAQADAQKIYNAEKAFEKAVAEKGVNAGFLDFLTADAVTFQPEAVKAVEYWKARPASSARLSWTPQWIDVSSNGVIGYSIGSSEYSAQAADAAVYGHYLTVWTRQPNGNYLASLDLQINHDKPMAASEVKWNSPADSGTEKNELGSSAADSSIKFYETAEKQGLSKAYKMFLADDVYVLRESNMPFVGRKAALEYLGKNKYPIKFARRTVFVGAADLAYIRNTYAMTDKTGAPVEKGNFVQVWKLRGGKWQIVADAFVPVK